MVINTKTLVLVILFTIRSYSNRLLVLQYNDVQSYKGAINLKSVLYFLPIERRKEKYEPQAISPYTFAELWSPMLVRECHRKRGTGILIACGPIAAKFAAFIVCMPLIVVHIQPFQAQEKRLANWGK